MPKKRRSARRRRRSVARANPPRRARRRYRRNPPTFSVRGILGDLTQGVKDVAFLEGGRVGTNFVSRMIPVTSAIPAIGIRAVVAVAIAQGVKMLFGREAGRLALAGGLSIPAESGLRALNVPILTGALSSDEDIARYFKTIGSYPTARRLGAYPTRRRLGDAGGTSTPLMLATTSVGNGYF